MQTPKLSIIVPVYNVQLYLNECVDSILTQDFCDYELILVDDGSTDESSSICDKYAKKDNRVIVIHKKNGGLSSARNAGLDIAKGKYITFVDSDDYLIENTYLSNMEILDKNEKIEILQYPTKQLKNGKVSNLYFHPHLLINSNNEVFNNWYNGKKSINYCCWNKIYKASVIKENRFPLGKLFEDIYFCFDLMSKVQYFYLSEVGGYVYRLREASITKSNNISKLFYNALGARCLIYIKSFEYNIDVSERCNFYIENIKMLYVAKKQYKDEYIEDIENIFFKNKPKINEIIKTKGKNRIILLLMFLLGKSFFSILYVEMIKTKLLKDGSRLKSKKIIA